MASPLEIEFGRRNILQTSKGNAGEETFLDDKDSAGFLLVLHAYRFAMPGIKHPLVTKTFQEFFVEKTGRLVSGGKTASFHLFHFYRPALYFTRSVVGRCVFGFSQDYTLYINQNFQIESKVKKEEISSSISQKEKDKIYADYAYLEKKWPKDVLKEALQFPEHCPFFKEILSDEKGRIYVIKANSILEKEKENVIDIFDENGYYIYQKSSSFYSGNYKRWDGI